MSKRKGMVWTAAAILLMSLGGCARAGVQGGSTVSEDQAQTSPAQVLTVMSLDAEETAYQDYIKGIEEKMGVEIRLISPDQDANNRMALFSTQLSTGDSTVDVYTLNDEMLCEFKKKGYLAAIPEERFAEGVLTSYPQEYLKEICMHEGSLYAIPFYMDIYMLWVNQQYLRETGLEEIQTQEDFHTFLQGISGDGVFGYGGAWEKTYSYNDIFEFINLFGGDCRDWNNGNTKQALIFLHDLIADGYASDAQLIDQYNQSLQKMLDGKYGSTFLYSGSIYQAEKRKAYSAKEIHVQMLPDFGSNRTNIAAWSYAVNNASDKKDLAYTFLTYVAGDEGAADYSNRMHRLPARLDILQGDLDIPDIEIMRRYAAECTLTVRAFTDTPMDGIEVIGEKFNRYILDELTLEELCSEVTALLGEG